MPSAVAPLAGPIPRLPATVRAVIEHHARRDPDAPAVLSPGRSTLTYARLHEHIGEFARALSTLGIGRRDRVAIVLPNGPDMAVAFLSVVATAAAAPLNPTYREPEFEFYLRDTRARALIVQDGFDTPAREVGSRLGIPVLELHPGQEAGVFELGAVCRQTAMAAEFAESHDVALVLHTSGTTARPKLVPLTQANLCHGMQATARSLSLVPADRSLIAMPLFHVHGLIGALGASMWAGGSVATAGGFHPARFLDALATFQPTWLSAVPTIHQRALAAVSERRDALAHHRLRFIRSCSAPLPPSVMAELEDVFGVPVVEAYGMTEGSHTICCNPLPPRVRKAGSVGVPAGPELAVISADGELLGPGQTGEVVIRGPSVTAGYENNPEANAAAFVRGWFRTGDLGKVDEEGYVFLTGRLKEMINRAGEKIAPREVDEALLSHPAVSQAVAFAIADDMLGEDLGAAVVLREGMSCEPDELVEHVATRLAEVKVPREVVVVAEIPKGPTGKVQRIGLAERLGLLIEPPLMDHATPPPPSAVVTAAESGARRTILSMWEELFDLRPIGIHDSFFDLGGTSLRLTRLAARVRAAFGVNVTLRMLFGAPTVAQQARLVAELVIAQIEALSDEAAEELAEARSSQMPEGPPAQ